MNSRILLVDDVRMFLEIEKEFFLNSYVDILTAMDGCEALDAVRTRQPDLVFMDLQMPIMDGATCCQAIKSDAAISKTPVVMITSSGNIEDSEKCFSAGCDYFLTKPVDRNKFLDIARKHVPAIDRREKRKRCYIGAVFRARNGTFPCNLYDLSVGGAYVASNSAAFPGEVIQISFFLPDGTFVECHGRIAWANATDAKLPAGFGIRFALISKKAKEAITKFTAN